MPVAELRIEDPATARIFADSPKRRLLLAFVDEARSVSDAAERVKRPFAQVHYHVQDLHRRGLLVVESERSRRGRPVKLYRAAASRFVVPVDLLDATPGTGLAEELRHSLERELFRSDQEVVTFYTEGGDPRVSSFSPPHRGGRAGEYWQILNLDGAALESFAAELHALLLKYQFRSGKGQPYLLHAAFAPRLR